MKIKKPNYRGIFAAVAIFLVTGCSLSIGKIYYSRGERALEEKNYPEALANFERIVKLGEKSELGVAAAQEGSKVALVQLKDYGRAAGLLSYLVLNASSQDQIIAAQKQLVDVYFNKIGDYTRATEEINRVLNYPLSPEDKVQMLLSLARSYFYLNDFSQSLVELDRVLKLNPPKQKAFEARSLRANVLMAQKRVVDAIEAIKALMVDFPEEAKAENTALNLAVAYEEKGDIVAAISTLRDLRPTYSVPEFIDLKIQRLEERQAQLPGARGLRK